MVYVWRMTLFAYLWQRFSQLWNLELSRWKQSMTNKIYLNFSRQLVHNEKLGNNAPSGIIYLAWYVEQKVLEKVKTVNWLGVVQMEERIIIQSQKKKNRNWLHIKGIWKQTILFGFKQMQPEIVDLWDKFWKSIRTKTILFEVSIYWLAEKMKFSFTYLGVTNQ